MCSSWGTGKNHKKGWCQNLKSVVLLDTSIGSLNQGDEIINLSIKKNWNELFHDNYIMRLATHTPVYTKMQCIVYKEKLDVFRNADYKFLCGTNAIYTNMLRPLPTWNINLLNCGLVEKTICLGVGIGINSRKTNLYTKKLYDKILDHDIIHSTRDEETKKFLISLGFRAENTGCPTLWGMTPEFCKTIPSQKGNGVVFTLTYYNQDEVNDKEMIDILSARYQELYFWPQCMKDLEYLRSLQVPYEIKIISPNIDSYASVLADKRMDYVGNRLHGGIFAMQHGCRTIIISIDYRAEKMHNDYSFECIDRKRITQELEDKIHLKWETKVTGLDFQKIKNWKRQFTFS